MHSQNQQPRTSRRGKVVRRSLVIAFIASAVWSLSGCNINISGFSQEAARELAEEVGDEVEETAAQADRPLDDYAIIADALHEIVDLDDYDDEDYRPTHTGLRDSDGDGLDDDGLVEIHVNGARACVSVAGGDVEIDEGSCSRAH